MAHSLVIVTSSLKPEALAATLCGRHVAAATKTMVPAWPAAKATALRTRCTGLVPAQRPASTRVRACAGGDSSGDAEGLPGVGLPESSVEDGHAENVPLFPWQAQFGSLPPFPAPAPTLLPTKEDPPRLRLKAGAPLELPATRLLSQADSAPLPLLPLSQSDAQGIILRAAMGTGWTTSTGLEGPSLEPEFPSPVRNVPGPFGGGGLLEGSPFTGESTSRSSEAPQRSWPELTSSPRRTSRVKFTCKRCGERTVRAINPHAYEEGTVFVQCGGCFVFHKLVDNLKLFHELQGQIFHGSDAGARGVGVHESVDILGVEDARLPPLPFN